MGQGLWEQLGYGKALVGTEFAGHPIVGRGGGSNILVLKLRAGVELGEQMTGPVELQFLAKGKGLQKQN